MKIVAFAGSNSSVSINRQLVAYTLEFFTEFDIEFLDMNDYDMPIYSIDIEKKSGIPEKAHEFSQKMANADGIICSLAEHNRSYTVAFKNVLDWSSRVNILVFADKPMYLMSTSPGGFGGGNVMNMAKSFFPKCGAQIIETFSLPSFFESFKDGKIIHEAHAATHLEKVQIFKSELLKN